MNIRRCRIEDAEIGIKESAINVDGNAFDQVFYEKTLASGKR